jgi:hypothetical protein
MRAPDLRGCVWVLLSLVTACTRWESYVVPTELAPRLPSSLRVSAPSRTSVVLVEPFVQRDTLYGRSRGDTLGVALNSIDKLERPRIDAPRTAATVLGGVAGWLTLGLLGGGLE